MPFLLQGRANFLKCFLRLFFACALYHLPISEVFTCSSDFYFQEKLQLLFTECDENFVFLKTTSWQLQQDVLKLIVYFFWNFSLEGLGDLGSCPPNYTVSLISPFSEENVTCSGICQSQPMHNVLFGHNCSNMWQSSQFSAQPIIFK